MCVWAVLAIFAIVAMSMARSKNTGKGKATSSSMERAMKKMKGRYFVDCEKGKRKAKRSFIRKRGRK